MKLTEQIIKDSLAGLIGQKVDYGVFDAQSKVNKALAEYAKANGLDPRDFGVHKETDSWTLSLYYKSYSIGGVDIKRKKGAYHAAAWGLGGSYDWTYKGFCVWLWDSPDGSEDVESRIAEIDRVVLEKQSAAARDAARGKEAVELLKKAYGLDDAGAINLIGYLYSNRYRLISE